VRTIAAIPSAALLAGAAFGLFASDTPAVPTQIRAGDAALHAPSLIGASSFESALQVVVIASVALAVFAFARRRGWIFVAAVTLGFFAGGSLLASVAWQRAWRPPLRVAFEALARAERADAEAHGRRMPEDDEAFAIVQGILRADAAPSENGVSLSVAVDGVEGRERREGRERQEGREGREGRDGQEGRDREGAPAAMPSRGHADPTRGVSEETRWGWGPAASGEAPAARPSRGLEIRGEASAIARGGGGAPPPVQKRLRQCRAEDWKSEARHQR
jgi:hypothetical protein